MSPGRAGGFALALTLLLLDVPSARAQRALQRQCEVLIPVKAVAGLREGSGLALSRRGPRRLFAMNDSGEPEVLVLNLDGMPRGKVTIKDATVTDWEDVTSGPCPGGACLYVSDIGDNNRVRPSISVYRMLEPRDGERQTTPVRFDAVYPDNPHDAEALFTGPDGRLFLITKEPRGAGLYGFPRRLTPDMPNRLERIATLEGGAGRRQFARITDAETSADGRTVAVRTNDTLFLIPTDALLAGQLSGASVFSLRQLGEPQGEGVALGIDGDVYLAGEGGRRRVPGTFARLRCMGGS